MKRSTTKTIAYLALYVALYIVLKYVGNLIPFLQMPNGGSIELELIAVFICSYHLGWKIGIADAILSWLMTIVLGFPMYFVQPVQILLDYVLPLVVCGVASLLWPIKEMSKPVTTVMGVVLAVASFFGIANSYSNTTVAYIAGAVVAAGMFGFTYWYLKNKKKYGIVISMVLKYICQLLSGVYFWFPEGSAAGSTEAWVFSAGYNLWYNLVTLVVCIIIVPTLIDRLSSAANIKFKA